MNYFSHRCNAVIVTDNVKWRVTVTTIWLNEACGVTHQLRGREQGRGDDDTVAKAMMIGWVGGCPAHAVSLHALTTAQDSDNGDEPGKFKSSVQ